MLWRPTATTAADARALGARDITLCDLALREGLVLDFIQRNRQHIRQVDEVPDVRRRSVLELGERCGWEADHAQQVARLALGLFDSLRSLHDLDDQAREWLEYAALLHDVGTHISFEKHHRHSYYLIRHGDLRGFEPSEIAIIALAARYHRRAEPSKDHEGYGDLSSAHRRAVQVLGAILRLSEALDRSRHGLVRDVHVTSTGKAATFELQTRGDAELELWAANRQRGALERALRRTIVLRARVVDDDDAKRTPRPGRRPRPARRVVRR